MTTEGGLRGRVFREIKSRGLSSPSSNPATVVWIYVRKFASLLAEGTFVTGVSPPPIKTGRHHMTERLLSLALKKVNKYKLATEGK